jgi:DNA-binding NarL/FixJ family response regulator
MADTAPIRVLIVDDNYLFGDALGLWLSNAEGIDPVGIARGGEEGIEAAVAHDADIVLMDIGMPIMDGLDATRRLLAAKPNARVIVVSGYNQDEHEASAMQAGAVGFLAKDESHKHVDAAIREAMHEARLPPRSAH